MPYVDKEKHQECQKRYRETHKEELREKSKIYSVVHAKERKAWYMAHREEWKAYYVRRQQEFKKIVTQRYGKDGGCVCCGITELSFLSIDHVKDDGYIDRKQNKKKLYWKLIGENFPEGFQTLCCNCQMGKRMGKGFCPHHPEKDLRKP